MTPFWAVAGLLCLFAMAFALLPLGGVRARVAVDTRRNANLEAYAAQCAELDSALSAGLMGADEHRLARLELDRLLLSDTEGEIATATGAGSGAARLVIVACACAVPLLAVMLYAGIGGAGGVQLDGLLSAIEGSKDESERAALMARALPLLEREAKSDDTDGGYRFLLARAYMADQRFPEAAGLFAELVGIYPEDAALIAQQAQALYLSGGRVLTPAVQQLVDRAFALDPAQVTLLGMIGMDRFQAGDYGGAIESWERLLAQLPPEAPDAGVIRDGIAMARTRMGPQAPGAEAAHAEPQSAPVAAPVAAPGPSLAVSVQLAPGLELRAGDTVFVFARALEGPPMPLAVARFPASELPREVELNDAMAMAPALKLSGFSEVRVTARVSRSGTVTAAPGDLEGAVGPVRLEGGRQALSILIDRTL